MTEVHLDLFDNAVSVDFDLFYKHFGVKIIGLTLKCEECGNKWGLSIWEEKKISDVKLDKLICYECERNKTK